VTAVGTRGEVQLSAERAQHIDDGNELRANRS
jgi:hypothetical protein